MKSRIVKNASRMLLLASVSLGTAHVVHRRTLGDVMDTVLFYGNLPARFSDAVTSFQTLPERMNPTRSECN
jgi:hypothetical protein